MFNLTAVSLTLSIMAFALSASLIPTIVVTSSRARDAVRGELGAAKMQLARLDEAVRECGCIEGDSVAPA
jgi:hypothetical protein